VRGSRGKVTSGRGNERKPASRERVLALGARREVLRPGSHVTQGTSQATGAPAAISTRNASTTAGSNCVPAQRASSASASSWVIADE
jgi:hypothetical protein